MTYTMGVGCAQCGELAYATVDCSLGCTDVSCDECGYSEYEEELGDDETIEDARLKGWKVFKRKKKYWKTKVYPGYGTIWFAKKAGRGFGVALEKPISGPSIQRILNRFESPEFDKSRCSLTVWDTAKRRLRYIFPHKHK